MPSQSGPHLPALSLLPLFLVSSVAIGIEIALTRFFALASWAEYGYWVISITMVGLTASGVVASLAERWLQRRGEILLAVLPLGMMLAAAGGWYAMTLVPFNPLELQNRVLWPVQVGNILRYYAALFPFFFLAGLYISLFFILHNTRIARVYGFDLAGAGFGALLVLGLMFVVHPFDLVAALLPLLAIAALCARPRLRRQVGFAVSTAAVLIVGELTVLASPARINEYKEIFGPMNAPGGRVLNEVRTPKGVYHLLDAFTERVDTDLSNNFAAAGGGELPRAFGLYHDGNRLGSIMRTTTEPAAYSAASLDALPYLLRPKPDVLLVGASGGFRINEVLTLGAASVTAMETDRLLLAGLRAGLPPAPPLRSDARVVIVGSDTLGSGLAAFRSFGLIDISRDFLAQSDVNRLVLSTDGIRALMRRLEPGGILSIPVSIREFTNYAVKLIATVDEALRRQDMPLAARDRVLIYRSAWNLRILISAEPWTAASIEQARAFCRERSFDIVYHPGIDPAKLEIYNEVPVVTFEPIDLKRDRDPLAEEAVALLSGLPSPYHRFFDLRPSTFDRPTFHATLSPMRLTTILDQIEKVPREELSSLINLAVLTQAILIAALVLLLPLVRRPTSRPPLASVAAAIGYFSGLGLGFLWLEIYLIEKVTYYMHDRTIAFALVLATMLIGSGGGSLAASLYADRPRRGLAIAVAGILAWCIAVVLLLDSILALTAAAPMTAQAMLVIAIVAPLAVFLGLPMAIGLAQFSPHRVAFLPWAWSVNGAWSIIATPLANIVALTLGLKLLVAGAAVAYLLVWLSLPGFMKSRSAT